MQDTQQSKRKQMTTINNGKTVRQPVTAVWRNGGLSASMTVKCKVQVPFFK